MIWLQSAILFKNILMIKHTILPLFVLLLLIKTSCSQENIDTIFTNTSDTIICHITLLNTNNIFYTYDKNKSTYISRTKVNWFILNSKDTETIKDLPKKDPITINSSSEKLYLKGQEDATKYYDDYNYAGTGTLVISLLSPLAGLIPAIACSSTPPKEKNLNFHNSELKNNLDYHSGYLHSAKKIKQRKVWSNWGIAFGINIFAAAIYFSNNWSY